MRHLALLLSAALIMPFSSARSYGQNGGDDRQYLSDVLSPVVKKKATFYREVTGKEGDLFMAKTYSMDGKVKVEGSYTDAQLTIPHGSFVFYHPNGRLESRGEYVNGLKTGIWERFDAWGQELAEKIYDPEPLANIVYTRAQTMPQYKEGDEKALVRYVKSKVDASSERRVKGTYMSTFVVEKDGSLSEVKVVEGQDDQIGEHVVNAIRSTAPWVPGNEKGQPVRVRMKVPVQF
ncbi:MAG: energy transducer TonB [Flavobacteriales bacterium]|nr:energy transducer TonB [Flavobacteriales bacterium]